MGGPRAPGGGLGLRQQPIRQVHVPRRAHRQPALRIGHRVWRGRLGWRRRRRGVLTQDAALTDLVPAPAAARCSLFLPKIALSEATHSKVSSEALNHNVPKPKLRDGPFAASPRNLRAFEWALSSLPRDGGI